MNGVHAVSHVVVEQSQEHEHVLVRVLTAQRNLNKLLVTQVLLAMLIVTQIVTHGAHGLPAVQHVTAVRPRESAYAHWVLKVCAHRRKLKIVVRRHVHQIPVHRVLDRMANGLNGDNAVKHVAVEFKIGSECCAVQTATQKNSSEFAQQTHVMVARHVTIVVTAGHLGDIAVRPVVEVSQERVPVVYM